ncbi:MAG: Hsp20/alpha crystallin family protein [Thermotogae bacterium]|uniref:Hsp20/alpha crystallin family protein n=1 Tax=Kosmotoga sp. TaxID=1955248 RepID=UPI000F202D99|nr:Hsp20/alpha crystallin family protein [Kosmotoga sp.]MBO8166846.1 Hsp20/alpha crystallin family protein [Kosmotoga sp.]MCD6159197.1 Hsp20/alpha crystallin family protein [Kosmotoga sp.]RKX51209.1 MAG: Hsp20/alpha crystallin family protein [Thermotogota bacterium]
MLAKRSELSNIFKPFEELHREIDRLFDDAFKGLSIRPEERENFIPAVDVYETDDAIFLEMEVPGIKKGDLKIKLEDGVLSVTGEKKYEKKEKSRNYHLVERGYGSFSRAFRLPDSIDTKKVKANYDNGVLKIELPKKEEAKKEAVEIKID